MLRDVFYYGQKPNVHPREKPAKNLEDARKKATTDHFWIVNEFSDYTGFDWDFDFDFLPDEDVWAQEHNNIWPSQHQKDGGTWLCPKEYSDILVYRTDVQPVKRKNIKSDNWKIYEKFDESSFDFSWHPDPTSPPYIYCWGTKYYSSTEKSALEYRVPNAESKQYMDEIIEVLPNIDSWEIPEFVDTSNFDLNWRPNPNDPPYIYMFGTQHQRSGGAKYLVKNATEIKFIDIMKVQSLPVKDKFNIVDNLDVIEFDYSWHPDETEEPYIYVFGNQHYPAEVMPTVRYVVEGATEIKYVNDVVAKLAPNKSKFKIQIPIDESKFDFSWIPDPNEPAYIYVWGNKHIPAELRPTLEYHVSGATEKKYMTELVELAVQQDRWVINEKIDTNKFDLTWIPDPREPPYIYAWGNKHYSAETSPTVEYKVPGATEYKYMSELVDVLPVFENWVEIQKVDRSQFDFTWRPNPKEPPYIYAWGNKFVPVEIQPTLEYHVKGATEYKYMNDIEVLPEIDRWEIYQAIDETKFDLSWRPDPREPAYIYVWGNKYIEGELQPTIEYHCPGATEKKYMLEHVQVLPQKDRWTITQKIDKTKFDLSWRPDPREPPFIYIWGNKYIPGEVKPTLTYTMPGATEIKYMGNVDVVPEDERWKIYDTVDTELFDLSWRPNPNDPPFIYVWGNDYVAGELQPTLEYHCKDATEIKYMGNVPVAPQIDRWRVHIPVDTKQFDMNWRPDPREPAYIYVWGNKHISAELKPTIEYTVPGATEKKYMTEFAPVLPNWERYKIFHPVNKFDFTWMPDPREPPYIYVWGNKHVPAELRPTLEYYVPEATERKYMGNVEILPELDKWIIDQQPINFDFTWMPDPREPAYTYVWGNKYIPAEKRPTVTYKTPGASEVKYMGNDLEVEPEWDKWKFLLPIDKTSFDFSWRPDPDEPPYVYVWGNQSNTAEVEPTIEYYADGLTSKSKLNKKYMNDKVVKTLPISENWEILIPIEDFDFSWRPNPGAPPYIYVFGNEWNNAEIEPTVLYKVPGATEYSYVKDIVAKTSPVHEYWKIILPVENFDFSWRPNPKDPPYIYVFGNQWNPVELQHTLEYHVPAATEYKYVTTQAKLKPTPNDGKWKTLIPVDDFDYSWMPDPREPPLIYVFGNKWNDANTEPSVEYHMTGATERKFMSNLVATPSANMKHWSVSNLDDLETFDFSWRPNPYSPPQIYQWEDNGPRYTADGATEVVFMARTENITKDKKEIAKYYIKSTLDDLIKQHPDEVFWVLNPDLNYDGFDFNWKPNKENFRHINVFGNETAKDTQTYYVNGPMYMLGYREYNYVTEQKVNIKETNLTMFFIDRNNFGSDKNYEEMQKKYPNLIKTRFFNSWVETISRCIKKSKTNLFWVVSSEYNYSDFQFDFYPSPWQLQMIHVFGTQWNHWGHTYLINGSTFNNDTKYVKVIEHLQNLNFVKGKKTKAEQCLYDVYLIDHGNKESENVSNFLRQKTNKDISVIKYTDSYLNTFNKLLSKLENKKEHHIWICSSVCDYTNFDFSFITDPFAKENLHVFASDKQKFGDTFLIDVNRLRTLIDDLKTLEDYNKISYITHISAKRLPAPIFEIQEDTHSNSWKLEYDFPYAIMKNSDNTEINLNYNQPLSLWDSSSKNIELLSTGGSIVVMPSQVKKYIQEQLYDYPYISKANKLIPSKPLDIVFLSNGEKQADENYEHLLKVTSKLPNRVVRVDGVNGRVQAYQAAAKASNTQWMFTVFAKLKVDENFDWNWQPDRLQIPKHYIFTAKNPINGLIYGHQAMIAYNKKLTLANKGKGLDFTLDDPHTVVEMLSGTAEFNSDPYSTWRTAFREVIKLKSDYKDISYERLKTWLSVAEGPFAQECLQGARDGVEYYDEVSGDFDKLRLSYEWDWLKKYYKRKYK